MGGACKTHGRDVYNILAGKPEAWHIWIVNIRMDLRGIRREAVNWINLTEHRN
jgi:hypothetical protein